jgi:sugar/nucleoside kinase (ribokinase family)
MASSAFRIHGAGQGLADSIFPDINFFSQELIPYHSRIPGDGGLVMGQLVFKEDFLNFAGCSWEAFLTDLKNASVGTETGTENQPIFNAGGPALVALTAASQFLKPSKVPVTYYGLSGDDVSASHLRHTLAQTPLDLTCFRQRTGQSPTTLVCSDSQAQSGHGDRFFVHDPGQVVCDPSILGESFFQATFNVYAGTAPLPFLHQVLPDLLAKGHHRGAINIVATVFDYASEKHSPGVCWKLGVGEAYPEIDLLVANATEVRKLAGHQNIEECVAILIGQGLTAAIITQGPDPVYYRSQGGIFGQTQGYVPVNADLSELILRANATSKDTVGAGDNFLGGVLADLMQQILSDDFYPKGEIHIEKELLQICPLRLRHAIEFGTVAGGLACLQTGGVKIEKSKGEQLGRVRKYFPDSAPLGRPW